MDSRAPGMAEQPTQHLKLVVGVTLYEVGQRLAIVGAEERGHLAGAAAAAAVLRERPRGGKAPPRRVAAAFLISRCSDRTHGNAVNTGLTEYCHPTAYRLAQASSA